MKDVDIAIRARVNTPMIIPLWGIASEDPMDPALYGSISVAAPSPIQKHRCTWCKGDTYDDDRGNCGACGGPR